MRLSVRTRRAKRRRVATLTIPSDADVMSALNRLRSWALTRDLSIDGDLSWTLEEDGLEARCPIPESVDIHPDTGIIARRVPARYEALVAVPPGHLPPEQVAAALSEWAEENGFRVEGAAEVFVHRTEVGYDLALPIRRKTRPPFIEV